MAQGEGGGRPLKFNSVKTLQKKINAYFAECDPHWIEEEYWEHPLLEIEDDLEDQPHGGALKRRRAGVYDYSKPMEQKTRMTRTPQKPYTITGLALALDTSRETLIDYENGNRDIPEDDPRYDPSVEKFSDTIKRAKLKVQNFAELYLYEGKNVTGAIFNLKNNHNWRDRSEVEEFGDKTVTVITRGAGSHAPMDEQPDDD
jgi:DNA-binding XRE family transcriptional regulator